MEESTELRFRYPGSRYFEAWDRDVFCGRDDKIQELYTKILLNKTVVLHAESGIGKSSLIQAGLIPLFKERHSYSPQDQRMSVVPVVVRFDSLNKATQEDFIVTETIKSIREHIQVGDYRLPYIAYRENSLWYLAKQLQLQKMTLLLVFDQFESLQNFSLEQISYFIKELSDLLHVSLPAHIEAEIEENTKDFFVSTGIVNEERDTYNKNITELQAPLKIHTLFVVREDKLGTMSMLSEAFPDILKTNYALWPLKKGDAKEAMMIPAQKGGNFHSPRFGFEDNVIDELLDELADKHTGRVDPFEIQLICSYIEKALVIGREEANGEIKISKDQIPVNDITKNFYENIWNELRKKLEKDCLLTSRAFDELRKEIISKLTVNGKRHLIHEANLIKGVITQDIVNFLIERGLIRKVPSALDEQYYQLCHDRLVEPLLADLSKLEQEEETEKAVKEQVERERQYTKKRRQIYWAIAAVLLILTSVSAVYYAIQSRVHANKAAHEQLSTTIKLIRRDNPTLSYLIARNGMLELSDDAETNTLMNDFDSAHYSYMTGTFPSSETLISASMESDTGLLKIVNSNGVYYWERSNPGMIAKYIPFKDSPIFRTLRIGTQNVYAILRHDSIEIHTEQKSVIGKFPCSEDVSVNNVAASKDGKYILINNVLFNMETGEELASLPEVSMLKDQMFAVFLSDNVHFAVGYWSGDILIYNAGLKEKNEGYEKLFFNKPKLVKWLYHTAMNEQVKYIAVDNAGKYLASSNRTSRMIRIWEIDDLNPDFSLDSILKHADAGKAFRQLQGHSAIAECMRFSPDSHWLLSGSDDQSAILWNTQTWEKSSVLKVKGTGIDYVNFSADGKAMITCMQNGLVNLWKKELPSVLYNSNEIAKFCPFDYYTNFLYQYNAGKVYDTLGVVNLFRSTLHYIVNIPSKNAYPDDPYYLAALQASVDEIKAMSTALRRHSDYTTISMVNRNFLSKKYSELLLIAPELLSPLAEESNKERFERCAKSYCESTREYLLSDTTDLQTARKYSGEFMDIIQYYFDSTTDYTKMFQYVAFAKDTLIKPFLVKYPENDELKAYATLFAQYHTTCCILSGDSVTAYANASDCAKIKGNEVYGEIDLVLVYLFFNRDTGFKDAQRQFLKITKRYDEYPAKDIASFLLKKVDKLQAKGKENKNSREFRIYLQSIADR